MSDWLTRLLPFVAPAVITAFGGALASAWLSPRRLRRELAADGQLLETVTGKARDLLGEDVDARAVRLSALNRYPLVTGFDVLRGFLIAAIAAIGAFGAWETVTRPPEVFIGVVHLPSFFVGLIHWQIWLSFTRHVFARLELRWIFVEEHGGFDTSTEVERGVRRAALVLVFEAAGLALVLLPQAIIAFALWNALLPDDTIGLLVLGVVALGALFFVSVTRAADLTPPRNQAPAPSGS